MDSPLISESQENTALRKENEQLKAELDREKQEKQKVISSDNKLYNSYNDEIEAISDIIDYEEISPDMVKDGAEYFALQLKGDSMEPRMSDGDVVIVRKQPDVDSGQIAIACVNGDHATCKKVMKQANGILLQPLNPTHAPMFFSAGRRIYSYHNSRPRRRAQS